MVPPINVYGQTCLRQSHEEIGVIVPQADRQTGQVGLLAKPGFGFGDQVLDVDLAPLTFLQHKANELRRLACRREYRAQLFVMCSSRQIAAQICLVAVQTRCHLHDFAGRLDPQGDLDRPLRADHVHPGRQQFGQAQDVVSCTAAGFVQRIDHDDDLLAWSARVPASSELRRVKRSSWTRLKTGSGSTYDCARSTYSPTNMRVLLPVIDRELMTSPPTVMERSPCAIAYP